MPQRDTGLYLPYLKAWRNFRVMSMEQLGEAAGLSRAAISKFELQRSRARITSIQRLAKALDITPEQLVHQQPRIRQQRAAG